MATCNPTQLVIDALATGPKSSAQLLKATGLTKEQVRDVMRANLGKRVRATPVTYSLNTPTLGVDGVSKKL